MYVCMYVYINFFNFWIHVPKLGSQRNLKEH